MSRYEDMDNKALSELYMKYAVIILLDAPTGLHFGIDMNSWNVGPNFKGVKLIPPGLHFIYYSAVSKEGQMAPRTGFFHYFKSEEILVKKWNDKDEEIIDTDPTPEEILRYRNNMMEMDKFLGPYPQQHYKKWVSLTENISSNLLCRLEPNRKYISSVALLISPTFKSSKKSKESEEEAKDSVTDDSKENQLQSDNTLDMKCQPGSQINFTEIPSERYPSGSSPAQVTKYGMDSSYQLENLLKKYDAEIDVLGELQLAFVCFLVGNVYDAFEQWKWLIRLMCTCDEAIIMHIELYTKFLTCIYYQIQEVPEDFFVDIISADNFLTNTLQIFFANIKSGNASNDFKMRANKFLEHLTRRFDWNFEDEPDDCAPVIVENV